MQEFDSLFHGTDSAMYLGGVRSTTSHVASLLERQDKEKVITGEGARVN